MRITQPSHLMLRRLPLLQPPPPSSPLPRCLPRHQPRPRHQPAPLTRLSLPAASTLCPYRHCTGLEVTTGVLADDASALMKSFFSKRREGDPSVEKPPQGLLSKPPSGDE